MGRATRALLGFNQTLAGRLLVGPAIVLVRFFAAEGRLLVGGDRKRWRIWARHGLGVAGLLAWVVGVCGLPLWLYLAGFAYAGLSLTLLRSFAEHRAVAGSASRTAVVRSGPILGLLFLNNNLPFANHAPHGLPWYRLPVPPRPHHADRPAARA